MTLEQESKPLTAAQKIGISDMAHTFDAFKMVAGLQQCVKGLREMAEGKSAVPMAVVYGGVGNGKTHLLEAVVIRLNERGLFTRYYTWSDIVGLFKSKLEKDADPSFAVLLERFCRGSRLVIDDVGMGTMNTPFETSQLEAIIDYRYRFRLFTVMATNLDISTKYLPERVVSRLSDNSRCALLLNKGEDYRKKKVR